MLLSEIENMIKGKSNNEAATHLRNIKENKLKDNEIAQLILQGYIEYINEQGVQEAIYKSRRDTAYNFRKIDKLYDEIKNPSLKRTMAKILLKD